MTLLITIISAVIVTVIWYSNEKARNMKIGVLCFMFWGASLMWLVDAVVEYLEIGADYFTPEPMDMLNDTFLGVSVIGLAITVWTIMLIIKDPNGIVRKKLKKNE